MTKICILFLLCAVSTISWAAIIHSHRSRNQGPKIPVWNKLSATWMKWTEIPIAEKEANKEGWKLKDRCDNRNYFKGSRYVLNEDPSLMLLFDSNGKIAGVQLGVPLVPGSVSSSPWVTEGALSTVTAYFKDPNTVCDKRRTREKYLGDLLWVQNGTGPVMNYFSVPLREGNTKGTKWTKGQCFWSMGQLYWYNLSRDMNCKDMFPLFLMYNDGILNGMGWAVVQSIGSYRFVQPTLGSFEFLFKNETLPKCLVTAGRISLQHLYFDDSPYMNSC